MLHKVFSFIGSTTTLPWSLWIRIRDLVGLTKRFSMKMEKKETSIALDIYFSLLCLSLTPLPTQPTLWFCDSQRNTVMAVGSLQTLSELRKMSPAPAESVATKPCLTDISAHNGFHLSWSWVSQTLLSSSEKLSAAEDSDTNSSQDCAVGASSYSW